ncbi:MAG TPA: hypothetical protein VMR95_03820 [Candidatus Binatia bacterium]|nr:hypothetical protein [Candidatus Binatia bacterium]
MGRLQKNNKGFTAVEVLLVLIIVVLIGFVGWYVYHTDHKTTGASNTTSNSTKTKATVETTSYFTIAEWGVRAPYSGDLTLEYSITPASTGVATYASLSSSQLDNGGSVCKTGADYGGVIERYAPSDEVYNEGGDTGQTASQYFTSTSATSGQSAFIYSYVGGYYYFYAPPQAACGSSQSVQNTQTETENAFKSLVQKLQAVPS